MTRDPNKIRRRYPVGPLIEAANHGPSADDDWQGRTTPTARCARYLAIARGTRWSSEKRQLRRWAEEGLGDVAADHAAVAIGFHPASIWPEWFPDAEA